MQALLTDTSMSIRSAVGAASFVGGLLGGSHRLQGNSTRLSPGLFAGKLLILAETGGRAAPLPLTRGFALESAAYADAIDWG
jgi:hypothetical protein